MLQSKPLLLQTDIHTKARCEVGKALLKLLKVEDSTSQTHGSYDSLPAILLSVKPLLFIGHEAPGQKADSTLRYSQAVPDPSTNWALSRLTSEVERDPVHSTRYGRQRETDMPWHIGSPKGSTLTCSASHFSFPACLWLQLSACKTLCPSG